MSEYICWDCNTKVSTQPWGHHADDGSRYIGDSVCPCCGAEGMEYL